MEFECVFAQALRRAVLTRRATALRRPRVRFCAILKGSLMVKYLHSMIRVTDPDATVAFFKLIGLEEVRRFDSEQGRFTLIFLAAPGQEGIAEVELTYNWPPEDGSAGEDYTGGRNFGHLAYRVDDIYKTCQKLADAGHIIHRPPRDGHMAFVKSPDGISIELLQDGHLEPCEPWASMGNIGSW
jgi:lactoylglutathione lyase